MRTLFVLAIFAAAAGVGTPAQAQNYPWCVISGAYEGGENCGFVSYAQCMATRMGIGGFCVPNTQYRPPGPATPAPRKPHN
jgi:hypothetical protein